MYYVTQQWDKAGAIAQRMLKGQFGALGPAAREYPQFAYAASVFWSQGREKALPEYMKVVRDGHGTFRTFTQCRAAYCVAHLAESIGDKEVRKQGRELLLALVQSPQQNEYTYKARVVLARNLIKEGRAEEGMALLRAMPKDAGPLKDLANYYLPKYQKEYEDKKKETQK